MNIIIHRGTKEIGGTCIELESSKKKLLLDLGRPLSKDSVNIDLDRLNPDAILISHPHQDHYGLIESMNPSVPVYIGRLSKNLIDATRIFLGTELLKNNFHLFEKDKSFTIGDVFTVKPYLVDHSSPEAFAFLIEAEGKRIFYSGDFRAHGNKLEVFEKIINNPPADIDVLFMEGTMIRRSNDDFSSEDAVKQKIIEIVKNQKNITFLISSSQNIDRLVSTYHACQDASKILVIDFYTAWVLEKMKAVSKKVPSMDKDGVKVYADNALRNALDNNRDFFGDFRKNIWTHRVEKDEMHAEPSRYVCISKMSKYRIIDLYKGKNPVNVIYSQWLGYLKYTNDQYYGAEEISSYQHDDDMVKFHYAHTSGHATVEDLQRFAAALKPEKLIPIHTEYASEFNDYFENVVVLGDGEKFNV